jgi:hypothetical protein
MSIYRKFKNLFSLALIFALFNLVACQADVTAQQQVLVEEIPDPAPPVKRSIKLALILDTSNSMDGLIDQAKAQLWNIVNELSVAKCDGVKPNLEIALYQYGNDNLPASEGYIQLVAPLTEDLDEISAQLFALSTRGGSEFCGQAIQTSLNQLDWDVRPEDYKVIFIAGNEPFSQGNVPYAEVCRTAKAKGIIVNTIHCGDFQVGINQSWKDGAVLAGGKYMAINQNSKTEFIPSPYDDQIAQLNTKLNTTYIEYGSQGRAKKQKMQEQDDNSAEYGQVNSIKRAVTKSSHVYKSESWDLVEANKKKDFKIESVEEEYLPEEMKTMDVEERKNYVAEKTAEREKIKGEIQALNKKREEHVAKIKKERGEKEHLDRAIVSAIRDQAQANRFVFPEEK